MTYRPKPADSMTHSAHRKPITSSLIHFITYAPVHCPLSSVLCPTVYCPLSTAFVI